MRRTSFSHFLPLIWTVQTFLAGALTVSATTQSKVDTGLLGVVLGEPAVRMVQVLLHGGGSCGAVMSLQRFGLFLWRACHNWLPCFSNLARHGVSVRDLCPFCFKYKESTFHSLWGCSFLQEIKQGCHGAIQIPFFDGREFFYFVLVCAHQLSVDEFDLFIVVVCRIWFRRNRWVHQKVVILVSGVLNWAVAFLSEFRSAVLPVMNSGQLAASPAVLNSGQTAAAPAVLNLA
ncbi:hypothetical protein ACOSQ2_012573 [Xanthoceras sorbifolium]